MTSTHSILRARLHAQAGIGIFDRPQKLLTLAGLTFSEWSPRFEMLMRNRMMMGALRYGVLARKSAQNYNFVGDAKRRLADYERTGNTELLVDVANLALLAFEADKHPNKHFSSTDDGAHCQKKTQD